MTLRLTEEEWEQYQKTHKKGKEKSKPFRLVPETIKLSEKEIQNQIRDFLRANGYFVIRHQQGLGSLKGLSDLTAIKNGNTLYIEVKTPKGVQSKYQKEFQEAIESHGGTYILARSIEDVKPYLKAP